jgi:hypothetical protein
MTEPRGSNIWRLSRTSQVPNSNLPTRWSEAFIVSSAKLLLFLISETRSKAMRLNLRIALPVLAILSAPVAAQVGDLGNVVDKKCVNGKVNVGGSGNLVTVKGYCPVAVVGGNGNVLRIDQVGKIEISGNGNFVEYRYLNSSPNDAKKKVHPTKVGGGTGNSVSWTKGGPFTTLGGM